MKRKTDICRPYKGSNIKEDEGGSRRSVTMIAWTPGWSEQPLEGIDNER